MSLSGCYCLRVTLHAQDYKQLQEAYVLFSIYSQMGKIRLDKGTNI